MKKILLSLLSVFFLGLTLLRATDANASTNDLNQYFQDIRIESQNFVFTRKLEGPRMSLTIGSDYGNLCEPGATFKVPFGSSFKLFGKHSGIKFDALLGTMQSKGFLVTKYADTRSLGGELQNKKAVILIGNGNDIGTARVIPLDSAEAQRILAQ